MITIIITTVYSRDLRYNNMMIESMMKLPDDMFRQELLPYLIVQDIVSLDNAFMNHEYRPQLLDKMNGVILTGDQDKSMKASLYKWLGIRRIYLINMNVLFKYCCSDEISSSSIENDYADQFRYTQHVFLRGFILDDIAILIISHCQCLLSIDISISKKCVFAKVTDQALHSITEHCTGLQSLSLNNCGEITDAGLITIAEHYLNLQSLKVGDCRQITDSSIISISTHCTGLQSLTLLDNDMNNRITDASIISISTHCTRLQSIDLEACHLITDASIISISTHCIGLQSLNLDCCNQITDDSIISISIHCTRLKSLNLENCYQITISIIISISTHCTGLLSLNLGCCDQISDACIISISTHCTGIQSLILDCCKITDASVISISENCTGLKELNVSWVKITDASLLAIAKNYTGLQLLRTYLCNSLSSEELRRDNFHSVSDLRAILLSIYPSLPI